MTIDVMRLSNVQLEKYIHMQAIVAGQSEEAARVLTLRQYYDGMQNCLLSQRQIEFLQGAGHNSSGFVEGGQFPFAHNHVRSVIDTLRERLSVTGINIEGATDEAEGTPQAQVGAALWDWWTRSRLDAEQIRLYRRALRDGKCYVMVDFDAATARPRFTTHHVDAGDNEPGIVLHRDPTDANRTLFATRHFTTFDPLTPGETGKQRKTVYLPDQIRKYVKGKSGEWEPYRDPQDATWPLPWADRNGAPLGIAVVEFANPGGSEVAQIIGLQNALNKAWLDLIAAADTAGFPVAVVEYDTSRMGPGTMGTGTPDEDSEGPDEIRLSPGRLLEVDDARVHRLEAADLTSMIQVIDRIEQAISGVSRTPAYYLRPVGGSDVPSGEALKQLESGLVRRAEERQLVFGQAWQDVFALAYKVNQAFGPSLPDLPDLNIDVSWADANVRNEQNEAATAEAHQRLGVPQETLWRRLGYTPEQIEEFKRAQMADKQAQVAMVTAALRVDQSRQASAAPSNGSGNGFNGNGANNGETRNGRTSQAIQR